MKTDLERFEDFLSTIDLAAYRGMYGKIKIVEQDMPQQVQALAVLYQEYWTNRGPWPDFPDFFDVYTSSLKAELEEWRLATGYVCSHNSSCSEIFCRGLEARIYRTWASILTQIQGAYVAETIYGFGNVSMNVKEDRQGKDLVIRYNDKEIPIQIKKMPYGRSLRSVGWSKDNSFVEIPYEVIDKAPLTPTGRVCIPYRRWEQKWGDRLKRLDNGFIVFCPPMFQPQNLLQGTVE